MKVYLIIDSTNYYGVTVAVFSTKEKALEFLEAEDNDEYSFEEFEVQ